MHITILWKQALTKNATYGTNVTVGEWNDFRLLPPPSSIPEGVPAVLIFVLSMGVFPFSLCLTLRTVHARPNTLNAVRWDDKGLDSCMFGSSSWCRFAPDAHS